MKKINKHFSEYLKEFKDFDNQMKNDVTLSRETKNKWEKFGVYFQIKMLEDQISTMETYNMWFKILTIALIIATALNIFF